MERLKNYSMGRRMELTKVENVSPEIRVSPFCFFLGVNNCQHRFEIVRKRRKIFVVFRREEQESGAALLK
jgi:hypothetical protein